MITNAKQNISHRHALPLLILVGSLLAVSVLLSKIASQQNAPMLTYLAAAMGASGLILNLVNRLGAPNSAAVANTTLYSLGAGAFLALASAFGYLTVHKVGAAFIALAMAFPPLLTWVMSIGLGLERFDIWRFGGLLIALAGGVMIAVSKGIAISGGGSAIIVACAMPVVLAIGNVFRTRYWPHGARPRELASSMLIGGAALTTPFALYVDGAMGIAALLRTPIVYVLAAIVATFVAQYTAFFRLQQIAGPVYLSQIGSVAALIGSPVAVLSFGERMPNGFGTAAALIVVGLAVFQVRSLARR